MSKTENPFVPLAADMIMKDIEKLKTDIQEGNYRPMEEALADMDKKYMSKGERSEEDFVLLLILQQKILNGE